MVSLFLTSLSHWVHWMDKKAGIQNLSDLPFAIWTVFTAYTPSHRFPSQHVASCSQP